MSQRRCRRIERTGDRRHRGREDRRQEQADQAGVARKVGDDEGREDLVGPGWRGLAAQAVEGRQQHADAQEEHELQEHHDAASQQCPRRLPLTASAEVALHHHVVGAVGAEAQHRAAKQPRPERVWVGEIE